MTLMNILVDNIGDEISEDDLFSLFKGYGEIASVNLVKHKDGNSENIAIVVMTSKSDAEKALNELNGKSIKGCKLKLSEAPENLS